MVKRNRSDARAVRPDSRPARLSLARRARRTGFTLVEMLVAVALTLFIMGLFAVLMQSATRGVREAKGIASIDQKLRNAVGAIRTDLRQVFLANNGSRFSPAELFTRADRIPTHGFFVVEANDRALHQGIDDRGNPIEHDHDNVLGLTVRREGNSAEEMFYGRAGTGFTTMPNYLVGGNPVDLGVYLDNLWKGPSSRFDTSNNATVTSQYAEVWYFSRPDGTATLAEVGADPYDFQRDPGTNASRAANPPALPKTFKLYRRQLLVLNDESLNRDPVNGRGVGPVPIPAVAPSLAGSFYHYFDVSATRELTTNAGELIQATGAAGNGVIHFNTLADLTRREFRYGMQPIRMAYQQFPPFNLDPYPAINYPINGNPRQHTLRAIPLSHSDTATNPIPGLHDYYRAVDPATRLYEHWIGRPTLAESAHRNYPWWVFILDTNQSAAPGVNMTVNPRTGGLNAYPVTDGQRAGDDVLLPDVLSFQVKALEYNQGLPGDSNDPNGFNPTNGDVFDATADHAGPNAAPAGDQTENHNLVSGGALYNTPPTITLSPAETAWSAVQRRRQSFVDLGYGADESLYTVPTGGTDDATVAGVNVLTLSNYLFQSTPAPAAPPFTPPGYTWVPPSGPVNFTAAPFTFAWPAATPVSMAIPGGTPNALMLGAYSPRSAPFGIPLDLKNLLLGPDVNDAARNSDVYLGPDGKPGLGGGFDDDQASPSNQGADIGRFSRISDTPTGEYLAPRSDDVDGSTLVPAMIVRPGILGPDNMPGERGRADDGVLADFDGVTGRVDWSLKRLTASSPPEPWNLSELFYPGTDDNPFVGAAFKLSGQVAANRNTQGNPGFHPFNMFNLNPRNTYDSWSGSEDLVSGYTNALLLPSYKASPVRLERLWNGPAMGSPAASNAVLEPSYLPEMDFRPVPYPRPMRGLQITIRVLERRTGIVREATIRHYFPVSQ
ncbi:MAG TPA: type II secretion system protein [Planctomycetia bacterium]|nr:type II secretion system protein [Planctomycetia bacterium]